MKRIVSLDMLRGYALVCIMLDHMPVSPLRKLTLTNFVVFDAAELFVLLSGFLVGLVWLRVEEKEGRAAVQRRFWRRSFEVWRALVIGSVLLALLSWLLFWLGMKHTAVWSEYSRMIVRDPLDYIVKIAIMWMQPNLMDVLALYVLLIVTVPLALPVLLRWPFLFMAGSVALWLVAVPLNALIPNQRPGPGLLFNPFGWQLLFYCGVVMGAFRAQLMAALRPWSRWLTLICVGIMVFSAAIVLTAKLGAPAKPWRMMLAQIHGPIDKWSLDGMRLLAALAASWLVAMPLSGLFARMAGSGAGRALAQIGRGGLWSFVVCVLLSILGDGAGLLAPKDMTGWVMRVAVDLWVIAALWVISVLWLQRHELFGQYGRARQKPTTWRALSGWFAKGCKKS